MGHSPILAIMKIQCLFFGLMLPLCLSSPLSLKCEEVFFTETETVHEEKCAIEHVKVCNGENQDKHHHENEKESKIICETEHVKHCETEHKLKCSLKFERNFAR